MKFSPVQVNSLQDLRSGTPASITDVYYLPTRLRAGEVTVAFTENSELLAGLCISAGSCLLHANLRDELEFFTKAANHGA